MSFLLLERGVNGRLSRRIADDGLELPAELVVARGPIFRDDVLVNVAGRRAFDHELDALQSEEILLGLELNAGNFELALHEVLLRVGAWVERTSENG